jgi:DNA-binding NarL/FixJ family response regulator
MPRVFLLRRCASSLQKARAAVAGMPGWQLSGAALSVGEACSAMQRSRPDIVACDLSLSDGRIDKLVQCCHFWPERPQILLLAQAADDLHLFDALRWGADAYCLDTGHGSGIVNGLRRLAAGRATMSPLIAQQSLALFGLGRSRLADALPTSAASDVSDAPGGFAPGLLLRAEQHLLSLLAHGLLSREIGAHWDLEEAEIERRLLRLYGRLHALLRHAQPDRLSA